MEAPETNGSKLETNPLADVEIGPEEEKLLAELEKEDKLMQLKLDRISYKLMDPIYKARNEKLRTIPKLWPVAMLNHGSLSIHMSLPDDLDALSYLRNVDLVRDEREPRAFQLDFEFAENPYFTNKVLTKKYAYTGTAKATPAEEVTEEHLDFDPELHIDTLPFQIDWKEGKSLTQAHPRQMTEEGDPEEQGSFFNWFEAKDDPWVIGDLIHEHVYPSVTEYFLGKGEFGDDDDEDEMEDVTDDDEEDEEDDDEEIDLEAPPKKRRRANK